MMPARAALAALAIDGPDASSIRSPTDTAFIAVDRRRADDQPGEIHALVGESGAGKTTIGNGVDGPAAGARTHLGRHPSR